MVVSARTQMGERNACLPCIHANDFYEKEDKNFYKKECLKRQKKSIDKTDSVLTIADTILNNVNSTNTIISPSTTASSSSKTSSEYDLVVKSHGIMGQFFR